MMILLYDRFQKWKLRKSKVTQQGWVVSNESEEGVRWKPCSTLPKPQNIAVSLLFFYCNVGLTHLRLHGWKWKADQNTYLMLANKVCFVWRAKACFVCDFTQVTVVEDDTTWRLFYQCILCNLVYIQITSIFWNKRLECSLSLSCHKINVCCFLVFAVDI